MIAQFTNDNGPCLYNVASFNQSINPIYNSTDKSYKFVYKNGHDDIGSNSCYNGRYINITFICEPNVYPYNINKTICDDSSVYVGQGICPYYFNIYTGAAC